MLPEGIKQLSRQARFSQSTETTFSYSDVETDLFENT